MPLSFSVPDAVLSTTLANYGKKLTDNIFRANPLLYYMVGKYPDVAGEQVKTRGKLKLLDGGESIVEPLLYERSTSGGAYSGYGVIDVTPQQGITAARYNWKQYGWSITISGREEAQNAGASRIINLLEAKMMQAEMSIKEQINADMFGTGNDSSLTISALPTLLATTGTSGGISHATNAWWQPTVNAAVGSFATNGLAAMRTAYNSASRGTDKVDLIISDQTTFERYENVLQPLERFNDATLADGGFSNLLFKGTPVTFDRYCASGTMYMLNSNFLGLRVHQDRNFSTTDFVKPANQDARTAQILFMGELVLNNASRHAVLSGITA